jgi:transposase
VREDTVRLWRSDFICGGFEALKASIAPGPVPVKIEAALRVITPLLEAPVADRPNWTIRRLIAEVKPREGVTIGRSQLSKALRKKKFRWRRPRYTLKGRQIAAEIDRVGLRLELRRAQAMAGDIVLLYADESEALTHPYLARAWAKRDADLRVPAPGQAKKVAMMGALDWLQRKLMVATSRTKRSTNLLRFCDPRSPLWSQAGRGHQADPCCLHDRRMTTAESIDAETTFRSCPRRERQPNRFDMNSTPTRTRNRLGASSAAPRRLDGLQMSLSPIRRTAMR